jgi:hypothetical protein
MVSLCDYDENILEEENTNRMMESLDCFTATINGEWFNKTPILLVYNKKDLLTKKIQQVDNLSKVFPKYEGGTNPEEALKFIVGMFDERIKGDKSRIETLITNIIAPDSVEECLNYVQSVAPKLTLRKIGELDPKELNKK